FSSIDKDLATGYIREMYECILALESVKIPRALEVNLEPDRKKHSDESDSNTEIKKLVEDDSRNGQQENYKEFLVEKPILQEEIAARISGQEGMEEVKHVADFGLKKSISEFHAERDQKKATLNDRYNNQGRVIADKLKQTPIKDLKSYIGLNKRFSFISSLFTGREKDYDEAITRVNDFESYDQALQFIQEDLMNKYDWKEDEPMVAEFFNLVMRRYLN
ncbi:MAG: hypothetical protein H0V65_08575, partial [Chitinophagales bacterium]|nr:hypothetical protein [Chitinophagales bacterium]